MTTPADYLATLPADRRAVLERLRATVLENLPEGFEEIIQYKMLGYVVPLERYPAGYHVSKTPTPLPFINLAAQKSHYALYHMGIYSDPDLLAWFQAEYAKRIPTKLNMGKSCIRFKNEKQIPYELIGELVSKMSVADWISTYERVIKK